MDPVSGLWWKMGAAFVGGVVTGIAAGWAYEKHQQGVLLESLKEKGKAVLPDSDEEKERKLTEELAKLREKRHQKS